MEAESFRVLTETGFVAVPMLLFVSLEHGFVEGLLGLEQVKHDSRNLVSSSGDGFRGTVFGPDTTIKSAQSTVAAASTLGSHAKGSGSTISRLLGMRM